MRVGRASGSGRMGSRPLVSYAAERILNPRDQCIPGPDGDGLCRDWTGSQCPIMLSDRFPSGTCIRGVRGRAGRARQDLLSCGRWVVTLSRSRSAPDDATRRAARFLAAVIAVGIPTVVAVQLLSVGQGSVELGVGLTI